MAESLQGYEKYRQFIDSLNENNVDEYIDLPTIAVMGDTSSGKSSLLSNISLVELPSNDNLTTHVVPLCSECNTQQVGQHVSKLYGRTDQLEPMSTLP